MGNGGSALTPLFASSEAVEAVAHAALHDAIMDVLAETDTEKSPHFVRAAVEAVRVAYDAVAMSIYFATQDGPCDSDDLERAMGVAASAEYGCFAAMTRWRGEWLAMLCADGDNVVAMASPAAPPPLDFLAMYGEALAGAFPVEPWGKLPQDVMDAIKELTRGYKEAGSSFRAITFDKGKPDPDLLPVAVKVLADLSETEAATMARLIVWRLAWIGKRRRRQTERPDP